MGATVLEGVNETPFHVTDSIVAHPRRFTRAKPATMLPPLSWREITATHTHPDSRSGYVCGGLVRHHKRRHEHGAYGRRGARWWWMKSRSLWRPKLRVTKPIALKDGQTQWRHWQESAIWHFCTLNNSTTKQPFQISTLIFPNTCANARSWKLVLPSFKLNFHAEPPATFWSEAVFTVLV
jgi:hypothetical protein